PKNKLAEKTISDSLSLLDIFENIKENFNSKVNSENNKTRNNNVIVDDQVVKSQNSISINTKINLPSDDSKKIISEYSFYQNSTSNEMVKISHEVKKTSSTEINDSKEQNKHSKNVISSSYSETLNDSLFHNNAKTNIALNVIKHSSLFKDKSNDDKE